MEDSDRAGGWDLFFHDQVCGRLAGWPGPSLVALWGLRRFLCAPRYSVAPEPCVMSHFSNSENSCSLRLIGLGQRSRVC